MKNANNVRIPRSIDIGRLLELYQQLDVGVDGAGVALTLQVTANGFSSSNLWGGNYTDELPASAQFVQQMQNWQEYTVLNVSMKFIPYDISAGNIAGVNATYIINYPVESVCDANNSIPTGSWYTQPGYKVTKPLQDHSCSYSIGSSIEKYNAAPYIPTGYPSTLASARSKFAQPPSLNLRISNPFYFATTGSIPPAPKLGRFYYRMLIRFDGAVYAGA